MKNEILRMEEAVKSMRIQEQNKNDFADRLVESYNGRPEIVGKNWYDSYNKNPNAIRRAAMAIHNQETIGFKRMSETQIQSSFPIGLQSLLKVIRIVVANMVYPEIFTSVVGQRWNEVLYYIDTVTNAVGNPARGDTGAKLYENINIRRVPTENERKLITGVTTTTYTMDVVPIRPKKIFIYDTVLDVPVAFDDGKGNIIDPYTSTIAGTVDYANGTITFTNVGTLTNIAIEYSFDSEDSDNYNQISDVELRVRELQFYYEPYYTGVSWSKMSELMLKGTLDQDVDALLTDGAIQALKIAADQRALGYGYSFARRKTPVEWSADWTSSGALSLKDHLDSFDFVMNKLSAQIFDSANRGVINKMYACSGPISILKCHRNFKPIEGLKAPQGAHKVGEINGVEIFQVPNKFMTNITSDTNAVNDIVTNFKNPEIELDTSLIFNDYVPVASETMLLEYKNLYKEKGLYSVGDKQVANKDFLGRIRIKNYPPM